MTSAEDQALRAMSVKQIRRAQVLVRMQQPLAYAQGNTRTLALLQEWEQNYTNEMLRRHTGD